MAPRRIRLSRARGYRKPAGAVVVARPSKWGNPYRIGADGDRAACVALFRADAEKWPTDRLAPLRGKDLACWCAPGDPCHADVLIELANRVVDPNV